MSAADRLDRSIAADRESRGIGPTEAEHQAQVIELAHLLGWHHLQDIASFATLSRVDVAKLIDALQAETAT